MQCVRCGTAIPENSKFCFSCGADQTGGGVATATTGEVRGLQERLQSVVQDQYRVEQLLGRGGMGAVFLAHDLTLEREVAIKVLPPDVSQDPQVIRRFEQEAKTAAKLDHPNIIPIYRVESAGGLNYFVMKYIAGTSLEDVLERREVLALDYLQRVLWEAACALGHAHQRGVVHRDVKPANIMFDHDGRVMLADFGISKALQTASGFTGTGMIIGTPHYIAPEQAKGAVVDGRADQYSLAVVGYRLVTGELPFGGDSVHTILYKHIFEEPPRATRDDVPAFLTGAIARALAKDPAQRFATMEEFATAVWPEQPVTAGATPLPRPRSRASAAIPTAVTAAPTTPMPAPRGRRWRAPFVAGALLVAAAGVGGYIALGRPSAPPPERASTGPRVTEIRVTPPALTLVVGQAEALRSRALDSTGVEVADAAVSWTSDNASVATVDQSGGVTAVGPGAALIEARAGTQSDRAVVRVVAPRAVRAPERAAPPATPPAAAGFITIGADPFGTVYIDGVQIGPTPVVRHSVAPGSHAIRIERPGFRTINETVRVDAGNVITKRYTLLPEG